MTFDVESMTQGFTQAGIEIQKSAEFERLRGAIERAMAPGSAKKFLQALKSSDLRVREFEALLAARVLERVDAEFSATPTSAKALYEGLPLSDQALMREFYLTRLEQIDPELRRKFHRQFETY